jgi:hypothetical protein
MPEFSPEDQIVPLEIYLAYEFLPAGQYARLLTTLDTLYETIVRDAQDDDDLFIWYYYLRQNDRSRWPKQPWLPLCIDSVETGQSISVRFAAKGESGSVVWRERDLDIILPRSAAPLCAIGAMLTAGAWSYEHYLDAQHKKAQTENVQAQTEATRAQERLTSAQVEHTRAQTAEILAKRSEPKRQQRTPASRGAQFEIHSQIQNFYSIVNQPNITRAEVNGVDVRRISDSNE